MRDIQIGEDVLAPDGERLGKVERIVVDERGDRVTHLVVADRVVDLSRLRDAGPDGLVMDASPDEFKQLARLEDTAFDAPAEHWQPPAGFVLQNFLALAAIVGQAPYQPPVQADIPLSRRSHEITAGSPVWAGDQRLGEVDHILTNDDGRTRSIVLHRDGQHFLVPLARVREVAGNNVHVDLDPNAVDQLERYTPPPRRTA